MNNSGPPRLSFSTLACPEWGPETIVERCGELGYDGIEWRGGTEGHVSTAWPAARRRALRDLVAEAGVASLGVTSYAAFTSPVAVVRDSNAADLTEHLRLAADLDAPFVRTFLGSREDEASLEELIHRVAASLSAVAPAAQALGVTIVVEQHDDFVRAERLRAVLERVSHPAVGAIWDIGNAWAQGERPETTFRELAGWIRYVHVKDGTGVGESWRLSDLGAGEINIADALDLAERGGADKVPICVEWEKAWHPHLAPASEALPHAAAFIRRTLDSNTASSRAGVSR